MFTRRGIIRETSIRIPAIVQDNVWANAAIVTVIAIMLPSIKKGLDGIALALRPISHAREAAEIGIVTDIVPSRASPAIKGCA